MKIGILTQPLGHNYGGTLQNFALQKVLQNLGHEVVTLNYDPQPYREKVILYLAYLKRLLTFSPSRHSVALPSSLKLIEGNFKRFERDHIKAVYGGHCSINSSVIRDNQLDAIIVGSDQVWRPEYNPGKLLNNMFLDFAENSKIKKIAYAASFGKDTWNLPWERTEEIKRLARNFNAVSVREESGIEICKKYFDVDAQLVLDPTLLLPKEVYEEIAEEPNEKDFVAVYMLDPSPEKVKFVEKFSRNNNKKPFFIGRQDQNGVWQSIEKWLGYIKYSDFVMTDSFHGTAFSINLEKKVISLLNSGRGSSRFLSLFKTLKLKNSFKENSEDLITAEFQSPREGTINTLEKLRQESIDWLKNALCQN